MCGEPLNKEDERVLRLLLDRDPSVVRPWPSDAPPLRFDSLAGVYNVVADDALSTGAIAAGLGRVDPLESLYFGRTVDFVIIP